MSLSSAGLALSLAFTKFVKPISEAESLSLLHSAWVFFALAIVATVASFLTSHLAIAVERHHIYEYYMKEDDNYANKNNSWGVATYWLNFFSAIVFVTAIISTVSYVWTNTQSQESNMQNRQVIEKKGYVPPKKVPADGGDNNQEQSKKKQGQ